jgi:GNAT superfamily N-acetyltransferase
MEYTLITADKNKEFLNDGQNIVENVWPEFMLYDEVACELFFQLYESFPEFQFWLVDKENSNKIVGIGNSIPLFYNNELQDLPRSGWDYALKKGFDNRKQGIEPNMVCALSITMNPEYRGKGISYEMVRSMINVTKKNKFNKLILPVRPSGKCQYPLISIESYIEKWNRDDGFSYDPWLRVHQKIGGKIIKPCNQSMLIKGTVSQWQNWTGMYFAETGDYIIDGGLVPVHIDVEKDIGIYIEPNVWMIHKI